MSYSTIKTVVILGGGTAGWMTAAALAKSLPAAMKIVLIESDEIGTIGVGEATVPSINLFNAALGIDVPDFMRACEATFKLGIEFVDWGATGRRYMHPFTNHGPNVRDKHFGMLWMHYAKTQAPDCRIEDYNIACIAAAQGRFVLPRKGETPEFGPLGYAFHIDAGLYAKYLRAYAEARGVKRIEGKAVAIGQHGESGDITDITLDSDLVVAGDLFVDCSGFQGLLIEKTLKTGYDDWSHWLPCNRAIAVPSENMTPPAPYTRSTADAAGWRWRIPLQHRTGNGHVYAGDFMSDDDAEERLLAGLDGPALAAPRRLKFVTGRRRQSWNHNCFTIGLSSGFLEPLESTSIYMIQTGIMRLLGLFAHGGFAPSNRAGFNRVAADEFESIRDFLILHYKLSRRDDSEFWRYCRDMDLPDAVAANIAQFRTTGTVTIPPDHLFPMQGWLAVMLGQGGLPDSLEPFADVVPVEKIGPFMRYTKAALTQAVAVMPSHEQFLKVLQVAQMAI